MRPNLLFNKEYYSSRSDNWNTFLLDSIVSVPFEEGKQVKFDIRYSVQAGQVDQRAFNLQSLGLCLLFSSGW